MILCPRDSPGRNAGVCFYALSWGSSWSRDWTLVSWVSCIGKRVLNQVTWITFSSQSIPSGLYLSVSYLWVTRLWAHREGNGTPLQYPCLENPMDGGAWWAVVHGVAKSRTQVSNFTFMHWRRKWQPTPVLAWRIPGTGEPGGLPSMGLHRVGHNWSDLAAAAEMKGIKFLE